jgi:prolipoprotein diacylglyceryl transferase
VTVAAPAILAYIPSPSANGVSIGPLRLHVYGLMIALGVIAAVWMAQRQWSRIGGRLGTMSTLAVWGVPGGLIGSRVYSLATSWNVDTGGHVIRAFEIWQGGLGIWGGILGGVATGLWGAHRHGLPFRPLLDSVAPALPLAQAVGRFGNYFNQELYGRPTTLPWGLEIDRSIQLQDPNLHGHVYAAFQPTFLYESIWDVIVVGVVIFVGRRFRIRRGYLFAVYAAGYTFGRFFTEYLRVDDAHRFYGLRLNDWTSILVFSVSTVLLVAFGRARPGDDRAFDPLPAGRATGPRASAATAGADPTDATTTEPGRTDDTMADGGPGDDATGDDARPDGARPEPVEPAGGGPGA